MKVPISPIVTYNRWLGLLAGICSGGSVSLELTSRVYQSRALLELVCHNWWTGGRDFRPQPPDTISGLLILSYLPFVWP